MKDITNRLNDLVVETAQTTLDGAYLAQRQNAQLVQSWYHAFEANQQASRDIVGKLFKQGQEAQNLWFRFAQESFRTTAENVARTSESQLREMSEHVATASRQAANGGTKAETKAK